MTRPKVKQQVMTVEQAEAALVASKRAEALRELLESPAVGVTTAALLLRTSKQHLYTLIREKKFPTPVIEVGSIYRIPSVALRALLKIEETPARSLLEPAE